MAEKSTEKNRNGAVAGRYWASHKTAKFSLAGFRSNERLSEAAMKQMAANNATARAGNCREGGIKLPNGAS